LYNIYEVIAKTESVPQNGYAHLKEKSNRVIWVKWGAITLRLSLKYASKRKT